MDIFDRFGAFRNAEKIRPKDFPTLEECLIELTRTFGKVTFWELKHTLRLRYNTRDIRREAWSLVQKGVLELDNKFRLHIPNN